MPVTNFIWDELSDNVLLETDENDVVTASYTNRPERFGELISQERSGVTSYFHYDGEHSTRNLTDSNEDVTDTFIYNAFGEEVARTGTTTNPFGYKGAVGYYTNEDTNDLYVRRRTYLPTIGRWLSPDPLGFIDGSNLYQAYFVPCGIDPSGLVLLYGGLEACGVSQSLGNCGDADWTIRWEASEDLTDDNDKNKFCFVIQHLKTEVAVWDCLTGKKKKRTLAYSKPCEHVDGETKNGHLEEMWEAWTVEDDKVEAYDFLSPFPTGPREPGLDKYETLSEGAGTWGFIRITGRAKIICMDGPITAVRQWFANWNRCGNVIAGILPNTTVPPTDWNDDNTLTHDMFVSWNCCCPDNWSLLETALTTFECDE